MRIICCIFISFLCVLFFASYSEGNDSDEVQLNDAINIATAVANQKNIKIESKDIEVLKVKRNLERGPLRLSWLLRYFPYSDKSPVYNSEFWVIFFYPKGEADDPHTLDGEFCVLIDLYSGKVLSSFPN